MVHMIVSIGSKKGIVMDIMKNGWMKIAKKLAMVVETMMWDILKNCLKEKITFAYGLTEWLLYLQEINYKYR